MNAVSMRKYSFPTMEQEIQLRESVRLRLVATRQKADLSQTELARASGLSLSYVKKIESGKSVPTVVTTWQYLHACNKSLGDFFMFWLPTTQTYRDRAIHHQIQEALKTDNGRKYVEQILSMLDTIKPR